MNAWRRLVLVFLLAAMPLHAALPTRVVGHWLGSYRGQPIEFQMNADGSGTYQGQPMKWQVRYGQLHIDREGEVEIYAMKVDNETMVIAGGPMATLLMLVRVSEPPALEEPAEEAGSTAPQVDH